MLVFVLVAGTFSNPTSAVLLALSKPQLLKALLATGRVELNMKQPGHDTTLLQLVVSYHMRITMPRLRKPELAAPFVESANLLIAAGERAGRRASSLGANTSPWEYQQR